MNRKKLVWIGVLLLFFLHFSLMFYGSTRYEYLSDDDPPDHAVGSYYFRYNQDVSPFKGEEYWQRSYLSPYPPLYDMLMGFFYFFTNNIVFTLKFFNALFVASSTIFGFLFFREFLQSNRKGLFAAFLLTVCPAFMSHFIWSQSLAIPLMLACFWCVMKDGKKWLILSVAFMTLVFLTQPSTAFFMGVLFFPLLIKRDWFKLCAVGVISVCLALVFFYGVNVFVFGFDNTLTGIGLTQGFFSSSVIQTSGGVVYGPLDLVMAPLSSKIDQATGLGLGIGLLVLLALVNFFVQFKKAYKNKNYIISVIWFFCLLLLVEGNLFPYKLFPHRAWAFWVIPCVILATMGLWQLISSFKNKFIKTGIVIGFIIIILLTCLYPKFTVQTAQWPPGTNYASMNELQDWIGLKGGLEGNVLMLCSEEEKPISFNLDAIPYDSDIYLFRENLGQINSLDAYNFMAYKNTSYFVFDRNCVSKWGINLTNDLIVVYSRLGDMFYNGEIKVFKLK